MTKSLLATTAVALALLGSASIAQAADVKLDARSPGVTIASSTTIDADKVIGRKVINTNKDTIGEVESVLTDKDGQARFAIVGVGGFLGVGERNVAVPWNQFTISADSETILLNTTKEQLLALPAHRYDDPARRGKVYVLDTDLKSNPYLADRSAASLAMSPNAVDVEKLIGRNIKNANDETVGEIDSVMIDRDGKARYVVANVGGFLGVGEKHVALAWDGLTITQNGERVTANVAKDALKDLPEFKYAEKQRRGVFSVDDGARNNPLLTQRPVSDTPPLSGTNSFTEGQAQSRIEAAGYTGVSGLTKDAESIWRGNAMKDGKSVRVSVDFKGNVVAN